MNTNFRDLDLIAFPVLVDPHDMCVIKRIVPWFGVAPFVLACQ